MRNIENKLRLKETPFSPERVRDVSVPDFWAMENWITSQEICDRVGGIYSWQRNGEKGYLYNEVTGYGIKLFVYLYNLFGDLRYLQMAQKSIDYINSQLHRSGGIPRGNILYVFDTSICLSGMLSYYDSITTKKIDLNERMIDFIYCNLSNRNPISLDGVTQAIDSSHWSLSYGSHLLKCSIALSQLSKTFENEKFERLINKICHEILNNNFHQGHFHITPKNNIAYIEYNTNDIFKLIDYPVSPRAYPVKTNITIGEYNQSITLVKYNGTIIPQSDSDNIIFNIIAWNTTGDYYEWTTVSNAREAISYNLNVNNASSYYELFIDGIFSQILKSNSIDWLTFDWGNHSTPKQFEIRRSALQLQVPVIISWSNSKTSNDTLMVEINAGEGLTLRAAADLENVTWNWYVDSVRQNWNYDNITLQWDTPGVKSVSVQVSNENGTGNMIPWIVEVISPPSAIVSSSAGGGDGGSGGGGGATILEPYENIAAKEIQYIWSISPGLRVEKEFGAAGHHVRGIAFGYLSSAGETAVVVEKLNNLSAFINVSPAGEVFEYFNIWVNLPGTRYLENTTIEFSVDKSWIASRGIDPSTIALFQYSKDSWTKPSFEKIFENESIAIYSATTNGFSRFAIVGNKIEANVVNNTLILSRDWVFVTWNSTNMSTASRAFVEPLGEAIKYIARYDESRREYQIYIVGFSGEEDDFKVEQGKTYLVYIMFDFELRLNMNFSCNQIYKKQLRCSYSPSKQYPPR